MMPVAPRLDDSVTQPDGLRLMMQRIEKYLRAVAVWGTALELRLINVEATAGSGGGGGGGISIPNWFDLGDSEDESSIVFDLGDATDFQLTIDLGDASKYS
jgi:hypothetical protein